MRREANDLSICHFGIKGQQWGVKHGPPYPLDKAQSMRIKAGSKVGHVTTDKKIKLDERGIYVFDQNDTVDSDVYRGAYATFLQRSRGGNIYEYTFTTKEDLLLPSYEEKVKTFIDLCKNDKDFKTEIDALKDIYPETDPWRTALDKMDKLDDDYNSGKISGMAARDKYDEIYDEYYSKIGLYNVRERFKAWSTECGTIKDLNYYEFMNRFMTDDRFLDSSKKFVDALSNKGYNAIIDDNNSGVYNGAQAPLYIFEGALALKEEAKARKVKPKEVGKAAKRVMERNNGNLVLSDAYNSKGEAL